MAFTWTSLIGVGNKVISTAFAELRTNTDWLQANRNYCATYNSVVDGAHLHTDRSPYNSADNAGHNVSVCPGVCSTNNAAVQLTYSPCDGSGCCFPAGTKVLMFDGRRVSIEDIRPNDKVMSFFGKSNSVLDIQRSTLGNHRAMFGFSDGSLAFTSDEQLWAKNGSDEFWSVSDYNGHLRSAGNDWEINGKVYKRHGIRRRDVLVQVGSLDYAHVMGWKSQFPVIRREFGSDTVIYSLILDGDYTHFVNGYITNGGVSDEIIDFSTYKWDGRGE